MKQPIRPLPWEIGECINWDDEGPLSIDIITKEDEWICTLGQEGSLQDVEYIVEACNNYHKAIEFLKRFKNHCNNYSDWPSKSFKEQITQFLKPIE